MDEGTSGIRFLGILCYRGIYGVVSVDDKKPQAELAKQLDEAIMNDPALKEHGVTGAMHQAVIGHLARIHKITYEGWLREGQRHRPSSDLFEFDGTMASVPTTEFSRKMDARKK